AASPFVIKSGDGLGLQLRISDGSTLSILPAIQEPAESEDDGLPEVADWELLSPRGLLRAGPRAEWAFEPSSEVPPGSDMIVKPLRKLKRRKVQPSSGASPGSD